MSSRYDVGGDWSSPVDIDHGEPGNAIRAEVAMNENGDAVAVWEQRDGPLRHVASNRYDKSTGWGQAEYAGFDTDSTPEYTPLPKVGIDDNGNAIAVWKRFEANRYGIWASRLEGGVWGTAVNIDPADKVDAFMAEMAMDAEGNAVVVWMQYDRSGGTRTSVWTVRYSSVDGSWLQARPLETDNDVDSRHADVAIDDYGNAVAVWRSGSDIKGAAESLDAAPPIADAGPDQAGHRDDVIEFDGSGSFDPAGQALSYHWHQVSGKEIRLRRRLRVNPWITIPRVNSPQTMVFILTVTSAGGVTATDTVTVTALP
jgi:hypothetical protein